MTTQLMTPANSAAAACTLCTVPALTCTPTRSHKN